MNRIKIIFFYTFVAGVIWAVSAVGIPIDNDVLTRAFVKTAHAEGTHEPTNYEFLMDSFSSEVANCGSMALNSIVNATVTINPKIPASTDPSGYYSFVHVDTVRFNLHVYDQNSVRIGVSNEIEWPADSSGYVFQCQEDGAISGPGCEPSSSTRLFGTGVEISDPATSQVIVQVNLVEVAGNYNWVSNDSNVVEAARFSINLSQPFSAPTTCYLASTAPACDATFIANHNGRDLCGPVKVACTTGEYCGYTGVPPRPGCVLDVDGDGNGFTDICGIPTGILPSGECTYDPAYINTCGYGGCAANETCNTSGQCVRNITCIPAPPRREYTGPLINFETLLTSLMSLMIPAALGFFSLPMILINGYKTMTSQGDPAKVKDAREGFVAAVLGTIALLGFIVIIRLAIQSLLGLTI